VGVTENFDPFEAPPLRMGGMADPEKCYYSPSLISLQNLFALCHTVWSDLFIYSFIYFCIMYSYTKYNKHS